MEKNKLMMVIIIALLVILLTTVVAVSFYVLQFVKNQTDASGQAGVSGTQIAKHLDIADIKKVPIGDALVTNLAKGEDGKSHVAKISVVIGYDQTGKKKDVAAFDALLNDNLEVARSIALACIHNSTYEDLQANPDGFALLADEIKGKLQEEFNSTRIVDVYINDWLFQ